MFNLTWRDYLAYYWDKFYYRYTPKGRKEQKLTEEWLEFLLGGDE